MISVREEMVYGFVFSTTTVVVQVPFDRIKLLMQTEQELVNQGLLEERYSGMLHCLRRTVASDGATSLFRGMAPNFMSTFFAPKHLATYAVKDAVMFVSGADYETSSHREWLVANMVAAAAGGAASAFVTYPFDYARVRLGADVGRVHPERQFTGTASVWRDAFRTDGLRGIYRGFVPTFLGTTAYRVVNLGVFDAVKDSVAPSNLIGKLALGWGSSLAAGLATYPLDTIRARMMMTSGMLMQGERSMAKRKYRGMFDCCWSIVAKEGVAKLWSGASVTVPKSLVSGLVLIGFDYLRLEMYKAMYRQRTMQEAADRASGHKVDIDDGRSGSGNDGSGGSDDSVKWK